MTTHKRTLTALLALTLALLGTPSRAQDTDTPPDVLGDWKIEKFNWTGGLGDATILEIKNPWGDVRCRDAGEGEMLVLANVQRHRDDPRKAEVTVQGEGKTLVVEVAYPETPPGASLTPEMEKRRVDVSVLIPKGLERLVVETRHGLVESKGVTGDVEARSESGNVVVSTGGSTAAHTTHGTIDVTFKSTAWTKAPSLETLTGDISVWLPPDASATVEAETRGELSTDYSITIDRRPPDDKKYAHATIGEGEGRLSVKTEKGRVRLFRSRF